jgi:hypothetical protein
MTLPKPLFRLAIAGAALGLSTAAAADAIVVRSTGPSATAYPVGRRIAPTERIVLRNGDRVVLVGEGATRTLSGPGNFPVRAANQANQNRSATLGRYLSTTGGTISRTGAVRGSGDSGPSAAPNLWVLNIEQGGNFCVADMANVTLWRADMAQDTLLTVQDVANPGTTSPLAFVAGQNFRRWPSDTMPIAEGRSYRISGPGMATPVEIRFTALPTPAGPADPEAIATALAEKGCISQLAQLGGRLEEIAGGR